MERIGRGCSVASMPQIAFCITSDIGTKPYVFTFAANLP